MIEPGRYSLTQIKDKLKISKHVWENRKEELLEHLKVFFDYDIDTKGRSTYFIIKEVFCDYQPLPNKRDAQIIAAHYLEKTREIVAEDPWNTGSNIARNIIAKEESLFNHKENTIAGYVRPIIREKFIPPLAEKSWRRLSKDRLHYEPLTEEQEEFLNQLLTENSLEGQKKKELEKFAEYKEGYITETELKDYLMSSVGASYGSMMMRFKNKFGFTPMLIKHLEEGAFQLKEGSFEFD